MQILVDADACPTPVKEVLFRAAERREVDLVLVANQPLRTPPSPHIRSIRVGAGFDVADARIVELTGPGDVVVTADIPLAAAVIDKGGVALNPRGETYTEANIRERLAMRDLMDELRGTGMVTGGPATYTAADKRAFANGLDRLLTRGLREG